MSTNELAMTPMAPNQMNLMLMLTLLSEKTNSKDRLHRFWRPYKLGLGCS